MAEGYFVLVSAHCCTQLEEEGTGSVQVSVVTDGWRQGQGWCSITLRVNQAPPAQVFPQSSLSLILCGEEQPAPSHGAAGARLLGDPD